MANNQGDRYFLASRVAVAIAAAMIFAAQPSHAVNHVFATFLDAGEVVSGTPIIALDVPEGRYAVLAKINLDQDDGKIYDKLLTVTCHLHGGAAKVDDQNVIRLHPSATDGSKASDNGSMPFQIIVDAPSETGIHVFCSFPASESRKLSFRFAKITAIKLSGSICERPSPAKCNDSASAVFATFKESGPINPGTPIVKMSIPSGKYAIFAKINIDQDDKSDLVTVACSLLAGPVLDRNVIVLQRSSEKHLDNLAMPFQAVHEFRLQDPVPPEGLHDISLACRIPAGKSTALSFRFAKIMAIRLDGMLCDKESPAVCA
jgi:hypothetical protein